MSSPIMATASPPSPRSLASTRSTRSTPRRWRRNAGRLPAPPVPARRSCRSPGSAVPVCLRFSARWLEPSNTSAPKPATLSKYHDDLRSGPPPPPPPPPGGGGGGGGRGGGGGGPGSPHPNPPPQAGEGVRGGAEDGWGLANVSHGPVPGQAAGRQDRLGPLGRRGWRDRPPLARRAGR